MRIMMLSFTYYSWISSINELIRDVCVALVREAHLVNLVHAFLYIRY